MGVWGAQSEGADHPPTCGVPQPDCLVTAAREQARAIRGEGDRRDRAGVPLQGARELPGGCVPQLKHVVITPESRRVPSREKVTDATTPECPSKVRISCPLAASHSFRVLSKLPESTRKPSGENATELT